MEISWTGQSFLETFLGQERPVCAHFWESTPHRNPYFFHTGCERIPVVPEYGPRKIL